MTAPARFYEGRVSHWRFGELRHVLRYRIAYLLIDLDRLEEARSLSPLLGIGRGGVLSFQPKDHGDGTGRDLASWVRTFLKTQGVEQPAERIELLTLPRMFGYVFNPVSVYLIRDGQARLHHVIYEVANTFGERHFYVCPVSAADGERVCRHSAEKAFYVSPFFHKTGAYEFQLQPPGETVQLTMRYSADDRNGLGATLSGKARPVTTGSVLGLLLKYPLMTLGVTLGIHWEALKLVLKGAKYHTHGPRAASATVSQGRCPIASAAAGVTLADRAAEVIPVCPVHSTSR